MPHQRQVVGRGQASGAAADDCDALAGWRMLDRIVAVSGVVGGIALQPADVYRVIDHAATAEQLARMLAY